MITIDEIADHIKSSGMFCTDIARKSGVNARTIQSWKQENRIPTINNLEAAMNVLGYTLELKPLAELEEGEEP